MVKNKIFAKLGIISLVLSLFFVFVGQTKTGELNNLKEEKQKILNELVVSKEWTQAKQQIKEDASSALSNGAISLNEYNDLQKELNDKRNIEKYINDPRLDEVNQQIEAKEEDRKTCFIGSVAGLGAGITGFAAQIDLEKEEKYC